MSSAKLFVLRLIIINSLCFYPDSFCCTLLCWVVYMCTCSRGSVYYPYQKNMVWKPIWNTKKHGYQHLITSHILIHPSAQVIERWRSGTQRTYLCYSSEPLHTLFMRYYVTETTTNYKILNSNNVVVPK